MKPFALVLCLALSLAGCVQSIQPFYKEDQLTYEPRLVGSWTDAERDVRVDVARHGDESAYDVTHTDKDGAKGLFHVHLAKVGDQLLADVAPADTDLGKANDTYKAHLLPLHSFFFVDTSGLPTSLKLTTFDWEWFKQYLKDHPAEAKVTYVESDRAVLTGSTDEVQAFLVKHLKTEGATKTVELKPLDERRADPARPAK